MAIQGIIQPEIIEIDDTLRLRKFTEGCAFALQWYQDEQTLMLVDGVNVPYDLDKLMRMYRYLADRGECYFIEARLSAEVPFTPIGDVTFWREDMPIVIGEKTWRGRGIGTKIIRTLVERAKALGFTQLQVGEIYDYNIASRKLFEGAGFVQAERTDKGHRYVR